jgi:hypothetical protein
MITVHNCQLLIECLFFHPKCIEVGKSVQHITHDKFRLQVLLPCHFHHKSRVYFLLFVLGLKTGFSPDTGTWHVIWYRMVPLPTYITYLHVFGTGNHLPRYLRSTDYCFKFHVQHFVRL